MAAVQDLDLPRNPISLREPALALPPERRAEFLIAATPPESARQPRGVAAGSGFQMERKILLKVAGDSFRALAFLLLSVFLFLSRFWILASATPCSSGSILFWQLSLLALRQVISLVLGKRRLVRAFRSVLALALFLLLRWIFSPPNFLLGWVWVIPLASPTPRLCSLISALPLSLSQLGWATPPASATRRRPSPGACAFLHH